MPTFLLALVLALCSVCAAQTSATSAPLSNTVPANAAPSSAAPAQAPAELQYFNRPLFTFRATLLGLSPADRAHRAQSRIRFQLAQAGPHQVGTQPSPVGIQVQIDGGTSFIVSPADLDPAVETTLEQSAQAAAVALRQAVADSAESRSWDAQLRALGWALAASAAAAALWAMVRRAHNALAQRLLAATQRHAPQLQLAGIPLLQRERLVGAVGLLLATLYRLFLLVLLVEWLSFVLRRFAFTRAWGESVNAFVWELAGHFGHATVKAVPELLTAALIFYLAYLASRALERFLAQVQRGELHLSWLDADVVLPTQRIAKVVLWLFALAMAYPYLPGSDTEAFKGLSVLVGLMLSMGASSLVSQAASGLILTYGRVYRKGEFVRLGEHEGTVTEVGMFTTRIRTGLGEEITLSNASILGGSTKNYSRAVQGAGFVLDTTVTIGYDTPWRQVHALLEQAARNTPGVLSEPAPQVFQVALSDWYPEYRLVCQAVPSQPRPRALLLSQLHANIQDLFNEYGVQIMSPQYFEDPAEAKLVPKSRWYAAPAQPPAEAAGPAPKHS